MLAASIHVCLQSPYVSVVFYSAHSNWSVQILLNVFQVSANRVLSQLDFQIFHFKYRNPGVGMHIEVSVYGTVYFLRVTKTADQEGTQPQAVRTGCELTTWPTAQCRRVRPSAFSCDPIYWKGMPSSLLSLSFISSAQFNKHTVASKYLRKITL